MIEEKELGLKIAVNPEEAFWIDLKDRMLKQVESYKREIIVNDAVVKLCEEKVKEINEVK